MPRPWFCLPALATALAAAALAPQTASADDVEGTRSDKLVERSHEILVRLDHGHATLRARRGLFNGGERHDQAVLHIDYPQAAVATGLRTRGELNGRPKWFDGKLMEAEAAAERYRELTGIGGYYPKDPALLSWRSQELMWMQVFPCAPDSLKMVEYTMHIPMDYEDGLYRLHLDRMGTDELPATFIVEAAHRGDQVFQDDEPVINGKRIVPDEDGLQLALGRAKAPRFEGRLGVVPFGSERVLTRFEFDGSRRFTEVPDDAKIVVLVDVSRSRSDSDVSASFGAAHAYLANFRGKPRARAQVLTFDREVHRHGRGLESIERAMARVEGLEGIRRNGSNVDDALAAAAEILSRAPRGATRRVVVMSDLRTRTSLQRRRAKTLAKRVGGVVHFGLVRSGSGQMRRDDSDSWDEVARATGGLVWDVWAPRLEDARDPDAVAAFEEWARPLRLDHVEVVSPGLDLQYFRVPRTIAEGGHFGWFTIAEQRVRHVRVSGQLWSTPVQEVYTPSRDEGDLAAALVFGDDLLGRIEEEEMMSLALRGGAVSPVTSYLAIEPGVRPSTEGLNWGRGTGAGFGGRGKRVPRVRQAKAKVQGAPPDRQGYLDEALGRAWNACGAGDRKATVTLESTWREVVDVPTANLDGAPDEILRTCLREAAWELDLPEMFTESYASWTVKV